MNINCNKTRCLLFLFRCFFQDQSTLTTKKWIIPVLFLFFSFFWTTLEQGRKETNYRFLEGEPSNLEYKCERSQSWKFKMRHRRIDPPKNTLKARSYVIRDIYRRKEKKEEEEKTSWSRSKPIEIKGICARSPPINNFAGVHQRPERKKNGRGKERKRKKKKKVVEKAFWSPPPIEYIFSCFNLLCNAWFNCTIHRTTSRAAATIRSRRSIFLRANGTSTLY